MNSLRKMDYLCQFNILYNHCINKMIDAGIEIELDESVQMDRVGSKYIEGNAYGYKVTYKFIRADMWLCGDKVGGSLSGL